MASSRPNILFILADDLGYADVSCYGRRDFTTPNIDRIAAEGVRFTQAYANSALCTASRVALMTGRYQYRLAVGLEIDPRAEVNPRCQNMARSIVRERGRIIRVRRRR